MQRFKLIIEYDGADYVGWQRQPNGPSIQATLEDAILAFCGEEARAFAAGRTDAGVHALGMIVHVDLKKPVDANAVREAVNHFLKPAPIAILHAEEVSDDFHARFSAKARHYLYRIITRRAPLTLELGRAWRVACPLDIAAMDAAAQRLVGKHDFTTFRAAQCQSASPVKTLSSIGVTGDDRDIELRVSAPSFLHHQVRSITGSLVKVGLGRWTAADLEAALNARDRSACGQVAPPYGLYFVSADY